MAGTLGDADDAALDLERGRRERHWVLSPTQRAFVEAKEQFTFYVGGVGAGKTFAGSVRAIVTALSPEYAGSMGVIAAPTYPMLEDATMLTFMQLFPEAAIKRHDRSRHILYTTNNTTILFRSLDKPDSLRGSTIAWFWIDEAPVAGYYAWDVLKARARQTPYHIAGWATGTPRGRDRYYQAFENWQNSGQPMDDHRLFRAPTWENAKHLPQNYISSLGYSGTFYKQEVLGEFTAFSGLVYSFDVAPKIGNVASPPQTEHLVRRIGGIDWGSDHPCAVIPIGIDANDCAYVLEEYVARGRGLSEHIIPHVLHMTRRYNITVWWCDSAAPQMIQELNRALDSAKLPCVAKGATKGRDSVMAGIQTVQRLLTTHRLYVPDYCPTLLSEFGQYQWKTPKSGTDEIMPGEDIVVKLHDDGLDALRYALHSTFGQGRSQSIPIAVSSAGTHADEDPILQALRAAEGTAVARLLSETLARAGITIEDLEAELSEAQAQRLARTRINAGFLRAVSDARSPWWDDPPSAPPARMTYSG